MEGKIPGSWVGENILLARNNAVESELVTLAEVNEVGLAYTYKQGEIADVPIFVPWGAVSWVRPSVPEDAEESNSSGEDS